MTGFPFPAQTIPALTTAQMVEVDRAMMEDYRVDLLQMMENAGRCLAHLARVRFFQGDPQGRSVVVLAGTGGNGGGALACARRLHNWGAAVAVALSRSPEEYSGAAGRQLATLRAMGVEPLPAERLPGPRQVDLIIDGLIGYSLRGAPRGQAASLIRWANNQPAAVLSLDVPSGVDAGTGQVYEPAVRAAATLTLALPKHGLLAKGAAAWIGELYLADIGVPPALYSAVLGLPVGPIFARSDILRLR